MLRRTLPVAAPRRPAVFTAPSPSSAFAQTHYRHVRSFSSVAGSANISSASSSSSLSSSSSSFCCPTITTPQLVTNQRFIFNSIRSVFGGGKKAKQNGDGDDPTPELNSTVYDKEEVHYTGKIFGIPTDTIFFYTKMLAVGLSIYLVLWTFFAGYQYLMSFSLATVGKLGFFAGFWTCAILGTTFMQLKKRYSISPNAVYNQAIAMVMKDAKVVEFLGQYPKTGEFRAFCATGGFKLPLLRRIRAGTYEMGDLMGTKPQKLQMMFVLKGTDKRRAMVSCDVRKHQTRIFSSSYHFHSLSVNMQDVKSGVETEQVIIGRDEDVVYQGLIKLK